MNTPTDIPGPPPAGSPAAPAAAPATEPAAMNPLANLAFLIVDAGLLVGFISAVVFVAGWSYADRYLAEIGLNLSAIEGLSETSFSGFALWVFRDGWLMVGGVAAAVVFVAFLVWGVRTSATVDRRLELSLAIGLLAALMLVGAGYLGAARARDQVSTLFSENYHWLPRLLVVPKTDSPLEAMFAERGDLGQSTCLRRIFMDHRNLYAYPGYESLRETRPNILVLPLSEIAAIEIINNPDLCRP